MVKQKAVIISSRRVSCVWASTSTWTFPGPPTLPRGSLTQPLTLQQTQQQTLLLQPLIPPPSLPPTFPRGSLTQPLILQQTLPLTLLLQPLTSPPSLLPTVRPTRPGPANTKSTDCQPGVTLPGA